MAAEDLRRGTAPFTPFLTDPAPIEPFLDLTEWRRPLGRSSSEMGEYIDHSEAVVMEVGVVGVSFYMSDVM